jgi:hypothetical protein
VSVSGSTVGWGDAVAVGGRGGARVGVGLGVRELVGVGELVEVAEAVGEAVSVTVGVDVTTKK